MVKSLAVLGLDAMPWHYFNRIMESGAMPYAKALINKSFKTVLECIPPVTPPSWTSIMTGVNIGKHGIPGFFVYDRRTWSQKLISASDVKYPRIHEVLSMNGVKSIVFNPIPDYPLIPASNTIQVSNLFFTPKPVSYPQDAYSEFFGSENPKDYTNDLTCGVVEEDVRVLQVYEEAIEKAINKPHTFLWVALNIPDLLFHRCPKILEKGGVSKAEFRVFSALDRVVKVLRENHSSLIVVSDHGFRQYKYLISVNDILIKHKLATSTTERKVREVGDYNIEKGLTNIKPPKRVAVPPTLYSLVRRLHLSRLARSLILLTSELLGRRIEVKTSRFVDPDNSKAFLPDHYTFGIYLKNPSLKEEVKELLRKYDRVLSTYEPEELFGGPYLSLLPDLIVLPDFSKGYWLAGSQLTGAPVLNAWLSAHHPEGILAVSSDADLPEETPEKLPN